METTFERFIITLILLGSSMFIVSSCSNDSQSSTSIQTGIYEGLPITPQPAEDGLCWERSQLFGPPRTWDEAKQSRPVDPTTSGSLILQGVGYNDVSPATYAEGVYFVPSDTPLDITFHILYFNGTEPDAEQVVRHIVLLNEDQLRDVVNEHQGPYYDHTLHSGEEAALQITVPELSEGVNELIILTLINPENYDTSSLEFYTHRVTLISDKVEPVISRSYQNIPKHDGDVTVTLNLSLGEVLKDWNWPEQYLQVDSHSSVDYVIEVGYVYIENGNAPDLPPPEFSSFALISFLDYEQIDVLDNMPIYYGEVSKDTNIARLNVDLTAPEVSGLHSILAVRINNPGIPTCLLQGPIDGYFLSSEIYGEQAWLNVG